MSVGGSIMLQFYSKMHSGFHNILLRSYGIEMLLFLERKHDLGDYVSAGI